MINPCIYCDTAEKEVSCVIFSADLAALFQFFTQMMHFCVACLFYDSHMRDWLERILAKDHKARFQVSNYAHQVKRLYRTIL